MSQIAASPPVDGTYLPDHTQLPDTDGKPVDNTFQPMQWVVFWSSLRPWLEVLHPDGRFLLAVDHGIYFQYTNPPLDGCRAPDLMVVEGVPPQLPDSLFRRSYVLWKEQVSPTLLIELVSGDGSEERDRTPNTGKFWIYEQVIKSKYYCIYDVESETIELYELVGDRYRPVPPDDRGHYPVSSLRIAIGTLPGTVDSMTLPWLRFFDAQGNVLPTQSERIEQELVEKERLLEKFRKLGIDPNSV